MTPQVAKHWRPIILILLIVGGLWTWILLAKFQPQLGLDLQGGISVVLTPDDPSGVDPGALEQAVNIIRNRVDALGVAEPDISRQGENILVQIPGIEDQARALELIGTTAKLRFRPVLESLPPADPEAEEVEGPVCGDTDTYPEDEPDEEVILCLKEPTAPPEVWPRLRLGPAALEGQDVSGATAALDPGGLSGWFVSLDLSREGARKFGDITGELACNQTAPPTDQLAIVLDRVIESAPQMGEGVQCNVGITGGEAQITGNFTEADAKDLALVLRYGALPVELKPSATTTVSPTLGKESLRSGLLAGLIGVIVVYLYVLFFYRRLGAVIWVGIGVHAAFTLSVVILLGQAAGFALSLAGIAGLIVSLGIAADSFIVYFERIKDEVVAGRTARAAVDRAWASARRTIIAADLVTALAAVVLYLLAVGSVRGFALMLGLATALDVFVSFWFMHPLVWLVANTDLLGKAGTLGFRASDAATAPAGGRA
ncbi:MAG TPA: protein translocase subunit SecD [Actinomycetota bacterium]